MHATRSRPTDDAILARLLNGEKPKLSVQTARFILGLEFPEEDKSRMHELAARAREGKLSHGESEEIDAYGRVGSLLAILKSRARQALKKTRSNGSHR